MIALLVVGVIMRNCAGLCKGMCNALCMVKAPPLLTCAGCARVFITRMREEINICLFKQGVHVRTRATPAHPAHPAHALFYAVLRHMHLCTAPCTPMHKSIYD